MKLDDEVTAKFCERYGWPQCSLCELPALGRVPQWASRPWEKMLVCFNHYLEYPKDPLGGVRVFEWIEPQRGRK